MTMYFLMINRQKSTLMKRAPDNKPQVNGKKHISGFYLLKVKYEACKVELAELKNRQMSALINRATDNKPHVNGKKADCSYWHLKVKYAACMVELAEAELQGVVQELPNDLKEKAVFQNEIRRTQMKSDSTRNYDENNARLTLLEVEVENDDVKAENDDLKATLVHERQRLEELMPVCLFAVCLCVCRVCVSLSVYCLFVSLCVLFGNSTTPLDF